MTLSVGEVGFLTASIKTVADVQIGDTITEAARPVDTPFPGFQEVKPMVFAGLYPTDTAQYEDLRDAMDKLRLNDASFFYEPEIFDRARFRFPLRISRTSSYGNYSGTAWSANLISI